MSKKLVLCHHGGCWNQRYAIIAGARTSAGQGVVAVLEWGNRAGKGRGVSFRRYGSGLKLRRRLFNVGVCPFFSLVHTTGC